MRHILDSDQQDYLTFAFPIRIAQMSPLDHTIENCKHFQKARVQEANPVQIGLVMDFQLGINGERRPIGLRFPPRPLEAAVPLL